MTEPNTGVFAVDWGRTVTDEVSGAPPSALSPGAEWRWHGPPTRLDGAVSVMPLGPALGRDRLRGRAALRLRRMAGLGPSRSVEPTALPAGGFSVTDGRRMWLARWQPGGAEDGLAVFEAGLPPEAAVLWVVTATTAAEPPPAPLPLALPGLAEGTAVATPMGPRPVETLQPGDPVLCAGERVRPLAAITARRFSGARLRAAPGLAPVRVPSPDGSTVRLAPGQRVQLSGPAVEALYGTGVRLSAAQDLAPLGGIVRERSAQAVTYHALFVAGGALVAAGGLWCEALEPKGAAVSRAPGPPPRILAEAEIALLDAATERRA